MNSAVERLASLMYPVLFNILSSFGQDIVDWTQCQVPKEGKERRHSPSDGTQRIAEATDSLALHEGVLDCKS